MADLIPDQLGNADAFSSFRRFPSPEDKRDLELCNPSCVASNGEVRKSTVAVKRGIYQLPNLDLSLLPPPEPIGASSFPYQHRGRSVTSGQHYCSVPHSPNPDVYMSAMAGSEQPPCGQLTIFHAGTVNVYNVSAEKARTIMMIASRISGYPDSVSPTSSASTPSTQLNPTPRCMDTAPVISSPSPLAILGHTPSSQTIKTAALQISRKCCIQRFLEKRNERIHGKGLYLRPAQK